MRFPILTILIVLLTIKANSQCNYSNTNFGSGEKISYEIYYNWGFIWLNAGIAEFEIQSRTYNNNKAFHFKSNGRTYKNYDWIFKVRDTFESIVDSASLTPFYAARNTNEDRYHVDNKYHFELNKQQIQSDTWNNESFRKKRTLTASTCTFDVLSAIYACRTINFNSKLVNDTLPLNMIIDGEIFNLHVRYLGNDTIVNKDNRTFNCNKFSVMLVDGTIFSGGENMFVWVSNDKNQIPVYIEAKILVGSVKAMVKDIEHTKWPANYQLFSTSKQ